MGETLFRLRRKRLDIAVIATVSVVAVLSLSACKPELAPVVNLAPIGVLDYRQPYAFDNTSSHNRLLIEVESRMRILENDQTRRYVLLSPHPREHTFDTKTTPYREMLASSGGGSEITFVHALDDHSSMITRRYEYPEVVPRQLLHECPRTNHSTLKTPRELADADVHPITNLAQLLAAAQSRQPIVGRLTYAYGNTITIVLDFPIRLVNINPKLPNKGMGSAWQAVSAPVPLLIGDPNATCESTRPAVFAFRDFSGTHSAVRLCELSNNEGTLSQDFSCPVEVDGTLDLFAISDPANVTGFSR